MKQLYLIRHGQVNHSGHLTHSSKKDAEKLADVMPIFKRAYCSKIEAAGITADIVAKRHPVVNQNIGFYFPDPEKEQLLFKMMHEDKISYLAAVDRLGDKKFLANIQKKASALNDFIGDRLEKASFNSTLLIVTDAVIIGEAMLQRNIPIELIPYLRGYVIQENGSISRFLPYKTFAQP